MKIEKLNVGDTYYDSKTFSVLKYIGKSIALYDFVEIIFDDDGYEVGEGDKWRLTRAEVERDINV